MALFARRSKGGNWDLVTDQTAEDLTFPADVLADILDSANEVSVWKIEEGTDNTPMRQDSEVLAAAVHSEHAENLSDVTLRFISDWKVKEELGLEMQGTLGQTVDTKLGGRHHVIKIKTVGDAIKLAKAFKARQEITFSRAEVMGRFAKSVQEKRIATKRITSGLWNKLIDGGFLQVVAREQPEAKAEDHEELRLAGS